MPPAAGLPIRLRPGLTRRPSSACAAARPGAPAEQRTRRSGLRRRSRHRQPPRVAQAPPHAEDHPMTSKARPYRGACRGSWPAVGVCVRRQPDTFHPGPGQRFGAQAPRHQPEPSSARPRCQGPPPAPGGPVPGPDSSLGNSRGDRGHPFQRLRGPGPVQQDHQEHSVKLGPAVCHHEPSPHCRPGGACAPSSRAAATPTLPPGGGQGGADTQVRPHPR